MNDRIATRPGEPDGPRVERVPMQAGGTLWRIRSLEAARQVLRARDRTTQAGFTAEHIPKGVLRHHPILVSDGPLHDEQRSKVGRFFAPKVVAERYAGLMAEVADRRLAAAVAQDTFMLDDLALDFAVEVTAEVVGLTESPVEAMARRLVTFFNQPPFDLTRRDLGRTPAQWARAARAGLVPIARLWWHDVRPAVRARRRARELDRTRERLTRRWPGVSARRGCDPAHPGPRRRDDVISHLIDEGYTDADILVECVTYGTAGMVTTRELIGMAALHLLRDAALRARFLDAEQTERLAILHEILRLEPVVGHLYRRARGAIALADGDDRFEVAPGDLVDVCVRPTNADPRATDHGLALCPGRTLPRGVDATGLAFGDGAHRCPGQPLAMLETDALLTRLLALDVEVVREPELGWDDLIAGYWLRGFELRAR
ncbi:cytochrome P450 [Mariniluteicoccus endophyticus]